MRRRRTIVVIVAIVGLGACAGILGLRKSSPA
jgi:hypothetical protein